jgi:nicastrin
LCITTARCIPIGGYSVFGSLDRLLNDSKPWVLGTAALDSSALFHDLAAGADADMSGTIALLAAAKALTVVRIVQRHQKFTLLS